MHVISLEKKHAKFLVLALLTSRAVTQQNMRVFELGGYWYLELPRSDMVFAVWYGFLAGRHNNMGYTMGGTWPAEAKEIWRTPA